MTGARERGCRTPVETADRRKVGAGLQGQLALHVIAGDQPGMQARPIEQGPGIAARVRTDSVTQRAD